jgi:hypothetical protein
MQDSYEHATDAQHILPVVPVAKALLQQNAIEAQ